MVEYAFKPCTGKAEAGISQSLRSGWSPSKFQDSQADGERQKVDEGIIE